MSLHGLYAITPAALCAEPERLIAGVEAALRGGAVLIQYRDKDSAPERRLANARALRALCRRHGTKFVINDDADLALAVQADGVHLGANDGSIARARAMLGPDALIGASCATSLERAKTAIAAGASYVAFGRFFDSRTKPDAPQATPGLLADARATLRVPICAIGGVTPDNGAVLVERGADLLAAVEGVFGRDDPGAIEAAAAAYARLFPTRDRADDLANPGIVHRPGVDRALSDARAARDDPMPYSGRPGDRNSDAKPP